MWRAIWRAYFVVMRRTIFSETYRVWLKFQKLYLQKSVQSCMHIKQGKRQYTYIKYQTIPIYISWKRGLPRKKRDWCCMCVIGKEGRSLYIFGCEGFQLLFVNSAVLKKCLKFRLWNQNVNVFRIVFGCDSA